MNSRILKKLSKKSVPLLVQLDCPWDIYNGDRSEPWSYRGFDYKSYEHFTYGRSSFLRACDNTPAVEIIHQAEGVVEYDSEPAYFTLFEIVTAEFTDYSEDGCQPIRTFSNPASLFKAAIEIIRASNKGTNLYACKHSV
jgi:hypothetical protein